MLEAFKIMLEQNLNVSLLAYYLNLSCCSFLCDLLRPRVVHDTTLLSLPIYLLQAVNTESEVTERHDLVGLFALYALYRHLSPSNIMPDTKLYKKLWMIQKEVPVVILHAKMVWFPPEFLMKYAAFDVRKLEPQDVEG